MNGILGECRVTQHAECDPVGDSTVRAVETLERFVVAARCPREKCRIIGYNRGICKWGHVFVDPVRPIRVTVQRVGEAEGRVIASGRASEESLLVASLRSGDETVFVRVVDRLTPAMLRLARVYGLGIDAAEDVVQETWIRVLGSLDQFEGRSSFRTWVFVILGNCARRRSEVESRSVPVSSFEAERGPSVDESRFFPAGHPRWAGMWTTLVDSWESIPDERLLAREARERFREAIEALPARYATVFVLRDVEGWSSDEVCVLLDLTPENQRVLLHRARTRLRAALEDYLGSDRA